MKNLARHSTPAVLLYLLLLVLPARLARAQNAFSQHTHPTSPTDYLAQTNGVCLGCQVLHPERAADTDLSNFATISTPLGLGTGAIATLRLRLNAPVPSGYVAGVLIGSDRLLDLVTLSTVRIRTYSGTSLRETRTGPNAIELKVIGQNRYVVEFVTSQAFDRVEVGLGGLNDAVSTLDVYYAYGIAQGTTPLGPGYYSNFSSPQNGVDYASSVNGICILCGVSNPQRAADNSYATNNYATIQTTAGVLASTRLRLHLSGVSPAGSIAGLVISSGSLIDLNVLNTLTIRTYIRNAQGQLVLQETAAGSSLLQLNLLTGNRYQLGFTTALPFEYVELSVGALASVLNTINVYYAFGLPGNQTLPVTLTAFSAQRQPNGAVRLTWQTAMEKNCEAFAVERAITPARFEEIGRLPGHGNSLETHEYLFTDTKTPGGGWLYYRLRELDTDGQVFFSNVVTVQAGKEPAGTAAQLLIWPNPAQQLLTVQLAHLPEGLAPVLQLTDLIGRTVFRAELTALENQLPIGHLPRGSYIARVIGGPAVPVVLD